MASPPPTPPPHPATRWHALWKTLLWGFLTVGVSIGWPALFIVLVCYRRDLPAADRLLKYAGGSLLPVTAVTVILGTAADLILEHSRPTRVGWVGFFAIAVLVLCLASVAVHQEFILERGFDELILGANAAAFLTVLTVCGIVKFSLIRG